MGQARDNQAPGRPESGGLESGGLDGVGRDRLVSARSEFDAQITYLNTATYGLPPRRSWAALQSALTDWRAGTADPASYDAPLARARAVYAQLVDVDVSAVAVGSQASVFAGIVATSLPAGSEVLTATGDFTSVLFPFCAQAGRGVTVREVPLERLADAVTARTTLVAVSAVQSADGRLVDVGALTVACQGTGTRIFLDVTQAVGWFPVDASRFAFTVCSGYKWLLAPRGTAFFTVGAEDRDGLVPNNAGWYAGAEPWNSIYGQPLRLARDARRFDVSPAWYSWVGAAPAIELLAEVGVPALHRHAVGLAAQFRAGIGMRPGHSAIVSVEVGDAAAEAMRSSRMIASVRAGRLRLSFHVSTSEQDVDHAIDVLRPHIVPRS